MWHISILDMYLGIRYRRERESALLVALLACHLTIEDHVEAWGPAVYHFKKVKGLKLYLEVLEST